MTPFALLETELQKEAARGDQLIKTLKAIAISGAHGTPRNASNAAAKLDKILGPGIRNAPDSSAIYDDVMKFVRRVREKSRGPGGVQSVDDVAGISAGDYLTGRRRGHDKIVFKKHMLQDDTAFSRNPYTRDYSQTVLDTLKRVTSGE